VLEIGCGGGAFLAELRRRWPDRAVVGLDLRGEALAHAHPRRVADLFQASVLHMPVAEERCALVTALDVFDQAGVALSDALSTCWSLLRPGGYLLLRVSALPWLTGPHDVAFGTGRRYHTGEVGSALKAANLHPVRMTHANSLLFPLAVANRLLQRLGLADVEGAFDSCGWLDTICYAALAQEVTLLRQMDLPIGSSLFCLAQRL
jgi:SAM-dependent methyltransferase